MKKENRYAVIDLGTNTFSLLVKEVLQDGTTQQLHKERGFVRLAEEGIETIGQAAFERGIQVLRTFRQYLDEFQVGHLMAFGTAALRTASNSTEFVKEAKEKAGIDIQIISGKEEARLIHQGVLQAIPPQKERMVIMDIGGGSVEFVIADNDTVLWSESYPIGVAVLHKAFHHSSPIANEEIEAIEQHLMSYLAPFFEVMQKYDAKVLVGASGTFDILENLMPKTFEDKTSSALDIRTFTPLYESLITTTLEERRDMKGIPKKRADMMIVAIVLIRLVLENTAISEVVVSSFAMKEGILKELYAK